VARIDETITENDTVARSIAAIEEQGAATAEIARNVSETATAANEMARRICEVSAEAQRTGGQAGAMLNDTRALKEELVEVKHAVTRSIRTSTADVDRRRSAFHRGSVEPLGYRRTRFGERARQRYVGTQCMYSRRPRVSVGTRGTLGPEEGGLTLPFSFHGVDDDALHVTFELYAMTDARFRPVMERLTRPSGFPAR